MIDFISLEVYNSIFNIFYQNNKFEFNTDTFDEFSFEEVKVDFEEIVNISDISIKHLQVKK